MQSIKHFLQETLRRIGIYNRLKASIFYDFYWRIAGNQIIMARSEEVDFYRNLLQGLKKGNMIFDIGANHGHKTDIFLRLGAQVVAVEPDEYNQNVLKQKFLKLRFSSKPVFIVGKAVSDRKETAEMWIEKPGSAMNTLSRKWADTLRMDGKRFGHTLDFRSHKKVQTITLEDLINKFGPPFFVKIDVEGHEAPVLRGLKHSVPFLSFEINLPEFMPEALECIEYLAHLNADGQFNYTADCTRGFALDRWSGKSDFLNALRACQETSIEIFWRNAESVFSPLESFKT